MQVWRAVRRLWRGALAGGAWAGLVVLPVSAQPFNDTGVIRCVDDLAQVVACGSTGQDAEYGRDRRRPSGADGWRGFSFAKIADDGSLLPAGATAWACVLDRVTGLMWEIKTDDGGLRDQDATFGNWEDGSPADAITYAAAVNAQSLCGHADWRLPTRTELHSIVDLSRPAPGPTLDPNVFPNSRSRGFSDGWWTSTAVAANPRNAWIVSGEDGAVVFGMSRSFGYAVRLVRRAAPPPAGPRFRIEDAEVADRLTGVVWRRCSDGQSWDGRTCSGTMLLLTWPQAQQRARDLAAAAGLPWRLPNAKELLLMADDRRSDPAIDPVVFPGEPTGFVPFYWSGSPSSARASGLVWVLSTFAGALDPAEVLPFVPLNSGNVRLVRDAPPAAAAFHSDNARQATP